MYLKDKYKYKYKGVTFVEMLMALAINGILLLAITTLFNSNFSYFNTATNSDTLEQQLQASLDIMTSEIKRAGFWNNASTDISSPTTNSNPFMVTGTTDISVTGGNCIIFTYDFAKDGTLATLAAGGNDDRFGFRLVNQTLQMRPPGATFACNAASNNWENVTDPSVVQITALSFTLNQVTVPSGATTRYMLIRSVTVSITGQLRATPTVTKTITQEVKIRNDKYVP